MASSQIESAPPWRDKDTQKEGHVMTGDQSDASTGQTMPKVANKPSHWGEAWKNSCIDVKGSVNRLILDSSIQDGKTINFYCLKPCNLYYSVTAAPAN